MDSMETPPQVRSVVRIRSSDASQRSTKSRFAPCSSSRTISARLGPEKRGEIVWDGELTAVSGTPPSMLPPSAKRIVGASPSRRCGLAVQAVLSSPWLT